MTRIENGCLVLPWRCNTERKLADMAVLEMYMAAHIKVAVLPYGTESMVAPVSLAQQQRSRLRSLQPIFPVSKAGWRDGDRHV